MSECSQDDLPATQQAENDSQLEDIETPHKDLERPFPWGILMSSNKRDFPHVELYSDEIWFGRKKDCGVVFKDSLKISAKHCRIWRERKDDTKSTTSNIRPHQHSNPEVDSSEGEYQIFIEDTSSNGTFVNDKRLGNGKKSLLCNSDTISLVAKYGHTDCVVSYHFQNTSAVEEDSELIEVKKNYHITKKSLGTGSFSVVREVIHKQSGMKYALKSVDKLRCMTGNLGLSQIQREVDILKQLKHENIVQIEDVFNSERYLHIILELASGGELFERIAQEGEYSENEARLMFRQMLEAVKYLHRRHIAHRDLKPENILIALPKSTTIKITDFGLARIVGERNIMKTLCGTPQYVAPEILMQRYALPEEKESSDFGYGKEVDMWSLGGILYVMLCGFTPFDEDRGSLYDQIEKGSFDFPMDAWGNVSEEAKDLVKKLLTVDPRRRITVEQALAHPWIDCDEYEPTQQGFTASQSMYGSQLGSAQENLKKVQAKQALSPLKVFQKRENCKAMDSNADSENKINFSVLAEDEMKIPISPSPKKAKRKAQNSPDASKAKVKQASTLGLRRRSTRSMKFSSEI